MTMGRGKRFRTTFTPRQLSILEKEFANQMYLVGEYRITLAQSLNLTEIQVKVWFQNRRIRQRKLDRAAQSASPKASSRPRQQQQQQQPIQHVAPARQQHQLQLQPLKQEHPILLPINVQAALSHQARQVNEHQSPPLQVQLQQQQRHHHHHHHQQQQQHQLQSIQTNNNNTYQQQFQMPRCQQAPMPAQQQQQQQQQYHQQQQQQIQQLNDIFSFRNYAF